MRFNCGGESLQIYFMLPLSEKTGLQNTTAGDHWYQDFTEFIHPSRIN